MADAPDDRVVSFDSEPLILVDADDRELGTATKAACHRGAGMLHRAFSLFVFDGRGDVILQKRARSKALWPGFWSNSCCSHPREGEAMEEAIHRRLRQELGLACPLRFLYKFEYQAAYETRGSEHELCWVYAGTTADPVRPNRNEVDAWRAVSPAVLDRELALTPERFTPWLRLEWQRLRRDFPDLFVTAAPRGAALPG